MVTGKMARALQQFVLRMLKESNEQRPRPPSRWVSRRKLSILCILSIPAFVQASSAITASTSSRRGSTYSGFSRRRYNTCVSVYWYAIIRTPSQGRDDTITCQRRCMNRCKIDCEQSPCHAFDGPLHTFGLAHEPHEHIVLWISDQPCNGRYQIHGPTNRPIIPVFPMLLHLRKSLLNHRLDKVNFLVDLGRKVRYHA